MFQTIEHSIPSSELPVETDAQRFWEQERLYVAPRFTDQVEAIRSGIDNRDTVIQADSSSVIDNKVSALRMTEGQAMLELDDYMQTVCSLPDTVIAKLKQPFNNDLQHWAMNFSGDFTFLGSKEYAQAIHGTAGAWGEYIKTSPGHVLNVHDRVNDSGIDRSSNKIVRDIVGVLQADQSMAPYLSNLRLHPEEWMDTPDAKLLIVDDYMSSGHTLRSMIEKAAQRLYSTQPEAAESLLAKAEIQLLVAQPSLRTLHVREINREVPIRAYYQTPSDRTHNDLGPSSFYSSMDYGFREPIIDITKALTAIQFDIKDPLLAHVDKPYRPDAFLQDAVGAGLTNDMLHIHNVLLPEQDAARTAMIHAALEWDKELLTKRGGQYADDPDAYRQARSEYALWEEEQTKLLAKQRKNVFDYEFEVRQAIQTRRYELHLYLDSNPKRNTKEWR